MRPHHQPFTFRDDLTKLATKPEEKGKEEQKEKEEETKSHKFDDKALLTEEKRKKAPKANVDRPRERQTIKSRRSI